MLGSRSRTSGSGFWSISPTLLLCVFFVDPEVEFSWTEEEVADLYDNTSFIIAADGVYSSVTWILRFFFVFVSWKLCWKMETNIFLDSFNLKLC